MSTYLHQSRTISIPSSLRRNICWMSSKSNVISKISGPLVPNTSGWCGAYMVLSPSLHVLLYQLWSLLIKGGQSVSAQPGSKSFPYSNFIGSSSKSWMSSTPIDFLKSVSVRGVEKPDRLLALEFCILGLSLLNTVIRLLVCGVPSIHNFWPFLVLLISLQHLR